MKDEWSVYFVVLEFLDILTMAAIIDGISLQQPVLSKLVIELLVLTFPPLLLWLTHHWAFFLPVGHQQLTLFPSQVIENTLIGGNFKVFIFLSLCELREVIVDDCSRNLSTFDSTSTLRHLQIILQCANTLLERLDKFLFATHVLLNDVLIRTFLERQLIEFALIFGVNDVILLGKRVFSQSFHVMRPKVPFLTVWCIFSSNETLIVSNGQENTVFALAFTIVNSGLVLKFDLVLIIIVAHSIFYGRIVHMLAYHSFFFLHTIVDIAHQEARYPQRIIRSYFLHMRQVG